MRVISVMAMLLISSTATTHGADADVATKVRDLIKATYGFKPSALSDQEREQKLKVMDAFWSTVKSSPAEALPVLRQALDAPDVDPFFAFDGSNLLTSLDESAAAKEVQIRAYAKADLHEVSLRLWVGTLAQLGAAGFDTTTAASKWLDDPKFSFSLPDHGGVVMGANEGALFLYGSMDEKFAVPALAKIVSDTKRAERDAAFWVLYNLMTVDGIEALRKLPPDGLSEEAKEALAEAFSEGPEVLTPREHPKMTRQQFLDVFHAAVDQRDWKPFDQMVEDDEDGEVDAVAVLKAEDLPLLRQVRRLRIAACNQHVIEDYDSFTSIITTMIWNPEWSKGKVRHAKPVAGGGGDDAAAQKPAPPGKGEMVYTLGKDERLFDVAKKFNVTLAWLIQRNDIEDDSLVKEGFQVTVPKPADTNGR